MEIITIIVISIILLINMVWIICVTILNRRLEEELQDERKEAIKEINKLRKGENKNDK